MRLHLVEIACAPPEQIGYNYIYSGLGIVKVRGSDIPMSFD